MIGYISGTVKFSSNEKIIVLCANGIGYELNFNHPMNPGKKAELFISHIIKEASQDLYAFEKLEQKQLFELLLKVKGVGPKSAYSLVVTVGYSSLIMAVQTENKKTLQKAPGVGAKAAAQIILDLKDKFDSFQTAYIAKASREDDSEDVDHGIVRDAIMAFEELGFSQDTFLPLVHEEIKKESITDSQVLIKNVLQRIG